MQIYDDPRKKKQQNKTKRKKDFSMHFAFTGYERMAIQAYRR